MGDTRDSPARGRLPDRRAVLAGGRRATRRSGRPSGDGGV